MKYLYNPALTVLALLFINACQSTSEMPVEEHTEHEEHTEVHLSIAQFNSLGMKIDTVSKKIMSGTVETNGELTLPPQSQAAVTAIIGSNVKSIKVIEGQKVNKGTILCYIFHPDLIELQTEYIKQENQLGYLETEYERQEKLFNESINSGKEFQKVKADYHSLKGGVEGLESKLKLLGMDPEKIRNGSLYENLAIKSPISGYIQQINIRTGQYVNPQDIMFDIINTSHIHAHFKVFEKDISKVKEGQTVNFIIESKPDKEYNATVFAVGKFFESNVKAVNIHAEIDNSDGALLPGMYARGQIIMEENFTRVLPNDAVVMDGDRYYVFSAEKIEENGEIEWHFQPTEVNIGHKNDRWTEIKFHKKISPSTLFAQNNAYYLIAELNKEEAGHDH